MCPSREKYGEKYGADEVNKLNLQLPSSNRLRIISGFARIANLVTFDGLGPFD
jgi:hypothetical protein